MNIFAKTKKIVLFYACQQSIAIAKAFSCKFYKQPHLFQLIITRNGFWWFNFQEYIKCLLNFYWSNQINLCVWLFFLYIDLIRLSILISTQFFSCYTITFWKFHRYSPIKSMCVCVYFCCLHEKSFVVTLPYYFEFKIAHMNLHYHIKKKLATNWLILPAESL